MNNLNYNIIENSNDNDFDINQLLDKINDIPDTTNFDTTNFDTTNDNYIALELYYSTNYTVKLLKQILDYYNINQTKLLKDEMIQLLVLFENDKNNFEIVNKRKRLWNNINELKQDDYFKKFIIFTPF